jgi:hypothetical protein
VPPEPARAGTTVTGRVLQPRFPSDVTVRAGEGCRLSEDGQAVLAAIPGNPYFQGAMVCVRRELVIDGGVSLSTGHVKFDGDLRILGHVQMRMAVEATGNVVVSGTVEGARITAGGHIEVQGGVRANALLESVGNVTVRFAEHAKVRCTGQLTVIQDLLHSESEVRGELHVNGAVIGGEVKLVEHGAVRAAGNKLATPTSVHVCVASVTAEEAETAKLIDAERQKVQATLQSISPKLRRVQQALASGRAVNEAEREALRKLLEFATMLNERDAALLKRRGELGAPRPARPPRFDVARGYFPGVQIQLGSARYRVAQPGASARFELVDDAVRLTSIIG